MNNIKIVIPSYKAGQWVHKTITSVKSQSYGNFKCIFIDDNSPDDTFLIAQAAAEGDERFIFKKNNARVGALENIYNGFKEIGEDDQDIYVTLDGDDWLSNNFALEHLNYTYEEKKCLITYGSFIEWPSGICHPHLLEPYPLHVIENNLFREHEWKASALRTFRRILWENIKKSDLIAPEENCFYQVAWDLAFMFPMIEMAGDRSEHIKEILYVYNKQNPISDMYVNTEKQLDRAEKIRKKTKYTKKIVDF